MTAEARPYAPPDVEVAYRAWGACAFAAILGRPVASVRSFFPDFAEKPWVNPSTMQAALTKAKRKWQTMKVLPTFGLVFVQIKGSWCDPGVPIGAAYKRCHWVAVQAGLYYDVNANGWISKAEWDREIGPRLIEANPGSTGFSIRTAIAVARLTPR